jgi:hypothetical protein
MDENAMIFKETKMLHGELCEGFLQSGSVAEKLCVVEPVDRQIMIVDRTDGAESQLKKLELSEGVVLPMFMEALRGLGDSSGSGCEIVYEYDRQDISSCMADPLRESMFWNGWPMFRLMTTEMLRERLSLYSPYLLSDRLLEAMAFDLYTKCQIKGSYTVRALPRTAPGCGTEASAGCSMPPAVDDAGEEAAVRLVSDNLPKLSHMPLEKVRKMKDKLLSMMQQMKGLVGMWQSALEPPTVNTQPLEQN